MPKTVKAGPELDCQVAVEVMGYKWKRYFDLNYQDPDGPLRRTLVDPGEHWLEPPNYVECDLTDPRQQELPSYYPGPKWSTEWSAAGEVVTRMRDLGFQMEMRTYLACKAGDSVNCAVRFLKSPPADWCAQRSWNPPPNREVTPVPLAICLAALEAVKQNQDGS